MPSIEIVEAGEYVDWAGYIADRPMFTLADGCVITGGESRSRRQIVDGLGAVAIASDASFLALGGEDGAVFRFAPGDEPIQLRGPTSKWVDAIACGPSSAIAASSGKHAQIFLSTDERREIESERSIEAMAFAPKGMRLALARYDGVDLAWINAPSGGKFLEWKGAHIGVMFSPDGRYVVSTMQENALHGWRLGDERHMRMTGYPSKVRSISWSSRGKWLASSGAPCAIVWPFSGKDGPMGKAPLELGSMGKIQATQVCFHPRQEVLAVGYGNGVIALIKIDDGQMIPMRKEGNAAISALGWNRNGTHLCFGSESGEAGIIDISQ